jgi:hypothetical protein
MCFEMSNSYCSMKHFAVKAWQSLKLGSMTIMLVASYASSCPFFNTLNNITKVALPSTRDSFRNVNNITIFEALRERAPGDKKFEVSIDI